MAGIHNTDTFFQSATKVVKQVFIKTNRKIPKLYPEAFNIIDNDSKRSFMTVLPLVGLGTLALKPEGQGPQYDQAVEAVPSTFSFVTYALGYKITEEAELEDPQNILEKLPGMLAYSEQITKELLFWQVLNSAFDATVKIFDGKSLVATNHPLSGLPGTTYSNSGGTVALTPESLQNAFVSFALTPDDRNLPIYRTPKKLIVPPQLHKVGEEVLGSPYYPYSNENRINVVEGKTELLVSRFLTTATNWFLEAATGGLEGDTHSLIVSHKFENKQVAWVDKATGNMSHRTSFRSTWGAVDWRGIYGSQGS